MGFFKSGHRINRRGGKRRAVFRRDFQTDQTKKAKYDHHKPKIDKKKTLEDEEIPSSSEDESIGEGHEQNERKHYEEEDNEYEDDSQTLAYREAKRLLESLKGDHDESGQEDEESEDDEQAIGDSVAQRLRQEALAKQAKLHQAVAEKVHFSSQQRIIAYRGHRLSPICVCFSSSGTVLVSCSKDGAVIKYDLTKRCRTGQLRPTPKNKRQHGKADGGAASAGFASDPTVDNSAKECCDFSPALCCAISPDDQYLVTGSVDGLVHMWRLDTLSPVRTLSGHRGRVTALRFRRQCTALELFSASADKTIKVWNLDEMGLVNTLYGHQDAVQQLDILQWSRLISCGGMDKSCRLFKVLEDRHLVFNGLAECVSIDCVAMINEEHFVSGNVDGSLYVWTTARKKPVCVRRVAHNGRAVPSQSSAEMAELHHQQQQQTQRCCPTSTLPPDHQPALQATPSVMDPNAALPNTLALSSPPASVPCNWICAVATLPYTDLVASGSADGWLRLWCVGQNYKSIEPVDAFQLHGFINDIRFSPDGNWLACAVGQEHKTGRWWTQRGPKVHNRVLVIPLEQQQLNSAGETTFENGRRRLSPMEDAAAHQPNGPLNGESIILNSGGKEGREKTQKRRRGKQQRRQQQQSAPLNDDPDPSEEGI